MDIKENINLGDKNTLGVKSTARYFIAVRNIDELKEAVSFAEDNNLKIIILGEGSNVCLEDIQGLVIKIDIKGITKEKNVLISGAGENWDSFVVRALKEGVPYIENLSGIPGTVGASPIQNIGAYGVEAKEIIDCVEVFDAEDRVIKKLKNSDCKFGYRDSLFKKEKRYIVTKVAFKILKADMCLEYKDLAEYFENKNPNKEEVRRAVLEIRSRKFPDLEKYGTAGSFFKNPIVSNVKYKNLKKLYPEIPSYDAGNDKKIPLAWILDKVCNLKGHKEGSVWLHDKQPLVLVTNKKVTAKEIKNFSEKIKKIVYEKTKIKIENEVVFKK